jgi:surfactin family lipopeptide synthetase A
MQAVNLVAVLIARKEMAAKGITFIEGNGAELFLSYGDLYAAALRALSVLQSHGLQPGDELVFQLEDNRTFVIAFWACILGGIVPVPLNVGQHEEHRLKVFRVWPQLRNPRLVTTRQELLRLQEFGRRADIKEIAENIAARIVDAGDVLNAAAAGKLNTPAADDIAFIQFSSGSTGTPKGVVLTHRNLVANMSAIANAAAYSPADRSLSWMPLTHDMGLIGFHLSPLFSGMDQFLLPTNAFVRRPELWMQKASEHRLTVLCSPNFGYRYFMKHHKAGQRNWDLSAIRVLYNGAEPVSAKLALEFQQLLSVYGLKSNAMRPVYGLAEATLAVSFSRLGEELIALHLDRAHLSVGEQVQLSKEGDHTVSFVNLGRAIDHCALRIAGAGDEMLDEAMIGHVQIKGTNVSSGYYNNETATAQAITPDGWLRTGDLGFVKDNDLYITGRYKDILFVNGQNYYPFDLERVAEDVEGIELNKIALGGYYNPLSESEEIIAFVLYRGSLDQFIPLARSLQSVVNARTGVEITKVLPVANMPKTTSGKLQRFKLVEQYRNGEFQEAIAALAALEQAAKGTATSGSPALNTQEQKLFSIWQQVLGPATINPQQSFFAQGGNSLKAAEVTMLIEKELGISIPLATLYQQPTISQLAADLDKYPANGYTPIPQHREKTAHPLSFPQKRIYYFQEINKASIAYNTPVAFRLTGTVDVPQLETCIRELVRRHEVLRMRFYMKGTPHCSVQEQVPFKLEHTHCLPEALPATLRSLVLPFDLATGPLFRIGLLQTAEQDYVLFMDFHHIITDGLSIYHFIKELTTLYEGAALPPPGTAYTDYIYWERERLSTAAMQQHAAFWQQQLGDELPLLELPTDFKRPPVFSGKGGKLAFRFSDAIVRQLKALAAANDCSLHVLLLTVYHIWLSKYTGQEDLAIGIPVAGRPHPDLRNLQGMFVNNVVFRSVSNGEDPFTAYLAKVKQQMQEALEHQDYPFDELAGSLRYRRDAGRNPLFDTMFIYQNMGMPRGTGSFQIERYFFDPGLSKFDLSMEIFEEGEQLSYHIEYAGDLFKKETIEKLQASFERLLRQAIAKPAEKIAALSLLSEEEFDRYIRQFNDTARPYPADKTVQQLFKEQALGTPGNIAIEYNGATISYQELDQQSDRLAVFLKGQGIGPNSITGILLNRSPELLVSMLGVLKAGGCYMPIETELPAERIKGLLCDSGCRLLITSTASLPLLQNASGFKGQILNINETTWHTAGAAQPDNSAAPTDLAYILYTSGTTGKPKGVMISHRSLINYVHWAIQAYVQQGPAAFPLYTSISFDLTLTSIFVPLLSGNRIVIYEQAGQEVLLEKVLLDNKVDIVKLTPSHLKLIRNKQAAFSAGTSRVRKWIVGGEELTAQLAREIWHQFDGKTEILNEYGPTEATVGCMIYAFREEDGWQTVPIGVPISNNQVYILDKYGQPLPEGVRGELYISGDSLAQGYLFNEKLSAERFVPNPFIPGTKMYKTGDVAVRLPGGLLEFIGRNDRQLKLNGFRIELAEIEQRLMAHPDITEALARVMRNEKGEPYVTAYYKSGALSEKAVRDHLSAALPYYMVPACLLQISEVPLTKNGKVDVDALPLPAPKEREPGRITWSNDMERILAAAWRQVLGATDPGPDDNFFDQGGDSIKAVQLSSWLLNEGIALDVKHILTYPSIEQLATLAVPADKAPRYEQGMITGEKGLSPIESWFFQQAFKNPGFYNQSVLLRLARPLDVGILQAAFRALIAHHPALRMNYQPAGNTLFFNNALLDKDLPIATYVMEAESTERLAAACQTLKGGFDITNGPLLKAALIQDTPGAPLLFITAHHLAVDGISWRILLDDLRTACRALENKTPLQLPPKTASLLDWEQALAAHVNAADPAAESAYWQQQEIPFAIPLDTEIPAGEWIVANTGLLTAKLDREQTQFMIREAYERYKTNVPVLLNTALVLSLHEWTGLEQFVVEQENHGRHLEQVDVSRTLGWFTVMHPLRLRFHPGGIADQIREVKEQIAAIPAYGIGYGAWKYAGGQALSPAPAEIRLNYLGQFDREFDNDLFSYQHLDHGHESAPENAVTARLEINAMVAGGELRITMHYNTKAHRESTMQRLIGLLTGNLERILQHISSGNEIHFTPADFDAVNLGQEELDALFK